MYSKLLQLVLVNALVTIVKGIGHCVDVSVAQAEDVAYFPASTNGMHTVGSEAEIDSCKPGYDLDGPPKKAKCEMISFFFGAEWVGLSSCEPVCPPIEINNATVHYHSTPMFAGVEATLECPSSKYHLEGPYLATCQDNHTWSTLPRCLKICPWFESQFQHHNIKASYDGDTPQEGVVATFSCEEQFGLVGSVSAKCQASGDWLMDAAFPECNPTCPANPVESGAVTYSGTPHFDGVEATVTCDNKHAPASAPVSVCKGADHSWDPPLARCEPICPELMVANSNRTYSGPVAIDGVTATFNCADGYHPDGPGTISCVKGSWNSPPPECKIKCSKPDLSFGVPRLTHDPPFHGSIVLFDCNDGFKLGSTSQDHSATCGPDGRWSTAIPTCIRDMYYSAAGVFGIDGTLLMLAGGILVMRMVA